MPTSHVIDHFIGGRKILEEEILNYHSLEAAYCTILFVSANGFKAVPGNPMSDWRPFVAPYVDQDRSIQVTHWMAYYEVTIFSREKNDDDKEDAPLPSALRPSNTPNEYVVVRIATKYIHVHSCMPGWDKQSHGDDGGIFHSSGGMVNRFGPRFGSGNTVGCGIDYVSQGIFFTLNGK
jgi:hypothetical protein